MKKLRQILNRWLNRNKTVDGNDLNKIQQQKLADWKNSHTKVTIGAIGGRYTYCYTPTSIGTIVIVKDSVTNTQIDLTDYDEW